jgi:hypothetical protein
MRMAIDVLLVLGIAACETATQSPGMDLPPANCDAFPDASTGAACPMNAEGTTCQTYGGPRDGWTCHCGDAGWLCGVHP